MVEIDEDPQMGFESEEDDDELSDGELQEAFAKGLLKPGLNVPLLEPKKAINNVEGLKKCLAEFKRNLPWAERLDLTNYPAVDIVAKAEGRAQQPEGSEDVSAEDDFQREMYFYRQAQATVLAALPKLHKFKIPTKRPEDYFAEMAKTDQHMQKIRKKLLLKQAAMDKSEKAKKLREQRKYGKKVQTQVIQSRQKQKKAMLSAVKKYQKGMTDKLDFLEGDQDQRPKGSAAKKQVNKKGPNSKKKYKDKKFGFGGKKKGSKWNTKDSHDDVSGFKARMAHGKGGKQFGKGGKTNKRPGKGARKKMKARK
ncbi:putative rRNA-processing protein EBP2 [Sinocyclocheilus anshuiensis]|uniref:EBNA1 binding protein 2 n=1 Tax=Sinocyclocheilus anshuiensis TaxID=1608454 RepID=A0A671PLV7_9TELE|nr:PREDICTED: probable rRNA-processing protein EBP2 [Sinocyclocheilus anshuiensis]